MFQPQKRPLSPSIKAVSIKASPAKEVVNKFYQNFSCPKCHANISFHGFVPFTKFQIRKFCTNFVNFKKPTLVF